MRVTKARILGLVCTLGLASAARADVGLGVGSDGGTLFVPITGSGLLIEPFFRYANVSSSIDREHQHGTAKTAGIGLFRRTAAQENFEVYYGARIAYLREETRSALVDPITGDSLGEQRREDDGYSVAPTVGVQFHLTRRLAVGGEIGWRYTDRSGDSVTSLNQSPQPIQSSDRSERRREAHSEIILRFFF